MRSDAQTLKMEFPELELSMECDNLRTQLIQRLKLQAKVIQDETKAFARVNLNDGYFLIFRPAATGFNGMNFWFKWNTFTNSQTGEERRLSQIRCEVELHHSNNPDQEPKKLISFGIDASTAERMVEKSLAEVAALKKLRLIALPITKIN